MSHDPMCLCALIPQYTRDKDCRCALIASVREDERSRERVTQTYEFGYRKGVAAAREAVAAINTIDYCYDHDCRVQRGALAAIDGLKP